MNLKVIMKATTVLGVFTTKRPEWSISELSRHLDIPKGTVHHILASFKEADWVVQDPETRRYRLGIRLWEMGWTAVRPLGLRKIPRSHLQSLAEETGETVHLSTIEPSDPEFVIYIDKIESNHPVRAYTSVGGRAPSYCVASGKVILAFNEYLLDGLLTRRLAAYSGASITDPDLLCEEMRLTRQRGYSVNREEYREDVVGAAAPIRGHDGRVFAAVGISGPAYRLPRKIVEFTAPFVMRTAESISECLGAAPIDGLWNAPRSLSGGHGPGVRKNKI